MISTCLEDHRETLKSKSNRNRRRKRGNKVPPRSVIVTVVLAFAFVLWAHNYWEHHLKLRIRHFLRFIIPEHLPLIVKYPPQAPWPDLTDANVKLDLPRLGAGEFSTVHYRVDGDPELKEFDPYILRIGLPKQMKPTLMKFINDVGLDEIIDRLMFGGGVYTNQHQGYQLKGVDHYENDGRTVKHNVIGMWDAYHPKSHPQSNMHWLSPTDKATHDQFMAALGTGGMDTVLQALADCYPNLETLTVVQVTFLIIAFSDEEPGFHHDFHDVDGKMFNIYIPLVTVPGTLPELLIQNREHGYVAGLHLETDTALVLGDYGMHGTSPMDYIPKRGYRLAATIHVADIDEHNVPFVVKSLSQYYPPHINEFILNQRGLHYRRDNPNHGRIIQLAEK